MKTLKEETRGEIDRTVVAKKGSCRLVRRGR